MWLCSHTHPYTLEHIQQQNQKKNSGHIVQLWHEKAQINIGAVTLPNL